MDRWQRVKEVFAEAFERPLEARTAFLDEACGANLGLRGDLRFEALVLGAGGSGARPAATPAPASSP